MGAPEDLPGEEGLADDQRRLRRIVVAAGGFLVILFLLALIVPIGTAVIANGTVGAESRITRISHPTGGVIAEIAVSNGDKVEKGEVLIRLEDTVSGASQTNSNMTLEQLLAQQGRLEAERLGSSTVRFPPALVSAGSLTARKAMADQTELFDIRRTETGQLQAQLSARILQNREQIEGFRAQITALERQSSLIEPELASVRDLYEQELVTINRLNQLERTQVGLDGSIASLRTDIAGTFAAITEAQQQLIQVTQSRRVEAATELSRINSVLNDQQTRSISASDEQVKTEIVAPYAGTIEKLSFNAIGEVIRPADPILEIVPSDDLTIVEASISPLDVDRIAVGQKARIRFVSFNLASTPEITGTVSYVASDQTYIAETDQSYFVTRIELDSASIRKLGVELRSGMPAEIYIETGDRSLISFLLKPIFDQFERAFKYD